MQGGRELDVQLISRRAFLTGLVAASAAGCALTPQEEDTTPTTKTANPEPPTPSNKYTTHWSDYPGAWDTEKGHLEPQGMQITPEYQ